MLEVAKKTHLTLIRISEKLEGNTSYIRKKSHRKFSNKKGIQNPVCPQSKRTSTGHIIEKILEVQYKDWISEKSNKSFMKVNSLGL